jgi:cysteine-rich repeat protein
MRKQFALWAIVGALAVVAGCGDGGPAGGEDAGGGDGSLLDSGGGGSDASEPFCGDGVVLRRAGEVCDDGNNEDGDDCRYDCYQDFTVCGDGALQTGEECDDGAANGETADAHCRTNCLLRRCGDGVVDLEEECDGAPGCGGECSWATGRM